MTEVAMVISAGSHRSARALQGVRLPVMTICGEAERSAAALALEPPRRDKGTAGADL